MATADNQDSDLKNASGPNCKEDRIIISSRLGRRTEEEIREEHRTLRLLHKIERTQTQILQVVSKERTLKRTISRDENEGNGPSINNCDERNQAEFAEKIKKISEIERQLSEDLSNKEHKILELEECVSKKEETIEVLNQELTQLSEENSKLSENEETNNSKIEELQKNVTEKKRKIKKIEREKSILIENIEENKGAVTALKHQLDYRTNMEQLQWQLNQISKIHEENSILQQRCDDLERARNDLSAQMNDVLAEKQDVYKEFEAQQLARTALTEDLQEKKTECNIFKKLVTENESRKIVELDEAAFQISKLQTASYEYYLSSDFTPININIKANGEQTCDVHGILCIGPGIFVLTDWDNKSLKTVDINKQSMLSVLQLEASPFDVAKLKPGILAVTLPRLKQVALIKFNSDGELGLSKSIKLKKECFGITSLDYAHIIVVNSNVEVYDLRGNCTNILVDMSYDRMKTEFKELKYVAAFGDKLLYLTDWALNSVTCLSMDKEIKSQFKFSGKNLLDHGAPLGLAVSLAGTVFIRCRKGVYLLDMDLRNGRSLASSLPRGICLSYSEWDQKVFVAFTKSNIVIAMASRPPKDLISEVQWYHGNIDRIETESRLKMIGQDGTFLVRDSTQGGDKHPYTLAVLHKGYVTYLKIRVRDDDQVAVGEMRDDEVPFKDVSTLIEYYKTCEVSLVNATQSQCYRTSLRRFPNKFERI
ncbi:uncharacterized protein LOC128210017 [Mya arenaria]|uniref:uncharacterized protein LOC128210017 n=1 Tax=Mya arenaria TaxID=6604 RepID=UPI0022DF909C|nr:uncharacterized protein LOC128210017 [Mya arenaria]